MYRLLHGYKDWICGHVIDMYIYVYKKNNRQIDIYLYRRKDKQIDGQID